MRELRARRRLADVGLLLLRRDDKFASDEASTFVGAIFGLQLLEIFLFDLFCTLLKLLPTSSFLRSLGALASLVFGLGRLLLGRRTPALIV